MHVNIYNWYVQNTNIGDGNVLSQQVLVKHIADTYKWRAGHLTNEL